MKVLKEVVWYLEQKTQLPLGTLRRMAPTCCMRHLCKANILHAHRALDME